VTAPDCSFSVAVVTLLPCTPAVPRDWEAGRSIATS